MEECTELLQDGRQFKTLISLPVELLVYIMSFLPKIRDRVKLRYVSRSIRFVCETPSLWREFVWPLYDRREKRSVMNVLKACGHCIKHFGFPDHVTPSALIEMLSHCNNVTQLSLPPGTKLNSEELRLAVQHMEHLEKLKVQLSTDIKPLLQIGGLKELTVHVPEQYHSKCIQWVQEWIKKHCVPCNFNLITKAFNYELETGFMASLLRWNFTPQDYTSNFKLYYHFEIPLHLFPNLPEFQLEIGQAVVVPLLRTSKFGIMDLEHDVSVLTDCVCGDKRFCKIDNRLPAVRMRGNFDLQNNMFNNLIYSLDCVTEFTVILSQEKCEVLEQLAFACPNLQRLKLQGCSADTFSLQGLRAIAHHCLDLCGLDLLDIGYDYLENEESHLEFWNILSKMRLTHVSLEVCFFFGVECDEEKLSHLFQKCSTLQAIQVEIFSGSDCSTCREECNTNWSLLSHFPALKYCRLFPNTSTVIQDVINSCKELTVLSCTHGFDTRPLLSSVDTSSLQQLSILEGESNVPNIFLETLSAHGGLVHVSFYVNSVSVKGITSLVENSPKLLTCIITSRQLILDDQGTIENLKQKFRKRKLFTVGRFSVIFRSGLHDVIRGDYISGTNFFPLWNELYY